MTDQKLAAFIGGLAHRRFDWVACNCFSMCADWVLLATGRDPAAQWRGAYASKAAAVALLRRAGGAIPLADRAMALAGAPVRSDAPRTGDVALVWAPVGTVGERVLRRPTGAICVGGNRVALMTADLGLLIAPLPILKAWTVARG